MTFEKTTLPLSSIHLNEGQIKDVPKNPRFIKDSKYEALKKSLADAPEMLDLRELLVYDTGKSSTGYVIIGGNMRYRAMKELGIFEETPVKIIPKDTPAEKLREYIIKDNEAFGQVDWDLLANEWDIGELNDWGVETSYLDESNVDIDSLFEDNKDNEQKEEQSKITITYPENAGYEKKEIIDKVKEALSEYNSIMID